MSRFGGLSEERPSVFKTRSKRGTHLSTQCSGDERQSRPCAALYRCVHLELVTSISTECFIQTFRHFIARRGRPSITYSDNGTNFVGASAGLKKVDWEIVVSQERLNPIIWKFIPPTATWWGGWWERLIRSVKNLINTKAFLSNSIESLHKMRRKQQLTNWLFTAAL
ncbi:integrase catalytic domain-containing protein [Trichonephila clavipes]|nr:integrase catalytic domain-containing protein [Trichonephila clavipes]